MNQVTVIILFLLSLTGTIGVLPDGWESSLWRSAAPDSLNIANPTPRQPVETGNGTLSLSARGAIAIDTASGTVLYQKSPDQTRPIASIVKLATAAMIVRAHSLDETVTVGKLPS